MEINKLNLLKLTLVLGAIYYLVAAFAHLFGLTIFPLSESKLYQPYHDTVIALAALIISMWFFVVAKDPRKNIDSLNVIIAGVVIALIFSIGIIWKIDFVVLGAPAKKLQTVTETFLLAVFGISIYILKPRDPS